MNHRLREWTPAALLIGVILALSVLLGGCASYSRQNVGFWDQHVAFTAWGFTMATEFGPFNIGYLQWNRNIDKPLTPATPASVLKATMP